MRKKIVAGNWKMNTNLQEGVALAEKVNEALKGVTPNCDVVIAVPFTHLASVNAVIDSTKLGLGAENCADKESGAYTGEVSASMVASTGATYVILGHSERRQYYGETSAILKEKVGLALENNLTPIFCIGEVLEERENGTYFDVVKAQIEEALFDLSAEDFGKIILAYEPVWAIGTGLLLTTKLKKCTLSFAKFSLLNMAKLLLKKLQFSMVVAANPQMLLSSLQNPMLTVVSSVAHLWKLNHSWAL